MLALSIVIVDAAPLELASVSTPTWPSSEVTPLPAVANPQLVLFCRQTVPLSFGKLMVRLAVGATKPSVLVKPLALALKVELALPWSAKVRLVAPIVRLPPGVIASAPELWIVCAVIVAALRMALTVTVVPSSLMLLSAIVFGPVNLDKRLVVPLALVLTVLGEAPQLPRLYKQTVSLVLLAMLGKL